MLIQQKPLWTIPLTLGKSGEPAPPTGQEPKDALSPRRPCPASPLKASIRAGAERGAAAGRYLGKTWGAGVGTMSMVGLVGGVLGGAILGLTLGGVTAPGLQAAVGTMLKSGGSSLGLGSQALAVLGGTMGLAGSWATGSSLGGAVGQTVGYVSGAAFGLARGSIQLATGTAGGPPQQLELPMAEQPAPAKASHRALSGFLAGVGGVMGIMGGAALPGVMHLASPLAAGLGVALLAPVMMVGGMKLAEGISAVHDYMSDRSTPKPPARWRVEYQP